MILSNFIIGPADVSSIQMTLLTLIKHSLPNMFRLRQEKRKNSHEECPGQVVRMKEAVDAVAESTQPTL